MDELNFLDPNKYDYLKYEPLAFRDKKGDIVMVHQVPIYDNNGELLTVIIGTYEMLDNLIDFYTRAALYDDQPKDLCFKIAEKIREYLDDITE